MQEIFLENKAIKDRIIKDNKTLFELEDFHKPVSINKIYNMKLMVIEIKHFQSKNT